MNNLRLTVWTLLTIAFSLVVTGAKADSMAVNDFPYNKDYSFFPWVETFTNARLNGQTIKGDTIWGQTNCYPYEKCVHIGNENSFSHLEALLHFHLNHEYKIVFQNYGVDSQSPELHTKMRFSVFDKDIKANEINKATFCDTFEVIPSKWKYDSCTFVPSAKSSFICFSTMEQESKDISRHYYVGKIVITDLGEFVTVNAKYGCASVYYGEKNLIVPEGYTAATYCVRNNNLQVSKLYHAGDVIAKGTGFVLFGPANADVHLHVTDDGGEGDPNNMLYGSDTDNEQPSNTHSGGYFYVLSHGQSSKDIGFHWYMENGSGDFQMPAHKAYLFVPSSTVSKVKAQYVMGNATGLSAITQDRPSNRTLYNLSGQQVDEHYHGLVICGGKKFYQE
jgi:hypothetical protein